MAAQNAMEGGAETETSSQFSVGDLVVPEFPAKARDRREDFRQAHGLLCKVVGVKADADHGVTYALTAAQDRKTPAEYLNENYVFAPSGDAPKLAHTRDGQRFLVNDCEPCEVCGCETREEVRHEFGDQGSYCVACESSR